MSQGFISPQTGAIHTDEFIAGTGNDGKNFTLSTIPLNNQSKSNMLISIDGFIQKNSSYSIYINTLTFTNTLTTGSVVHVFYVTGVTISNALTLNGAQLSTDGTFASNTDSKVPTEKAINTKIDSGWLASNETWTYASASAPNYTLTVPTDLTTKYSKDMKVRLTQQQTLTHYWDFQNNTDLIAGTIMTDIGTPTYTSGKFVNALTLNGSSQALKCDDNTFKPTGDFTVGMWVKSSYTAASQAIFQSWRVATSVASGFYIYTNITTGKISVQIAKNTGIVLNTDYSLINGKTNVCDNVWHYVVCTYKNNMFKIYVDGALDGFGYSFAPVYNATTYTRIGVCTNDGTTNTSWFNGQIDDLFLINGSVLDEQTIREKYVAQTAQGVGALTLTKYFIINSANYSAPNTTLSIFGGTDYSLANSAISSPYYAMVETPFRMDKNANKWNLQAYPYCSFLTAGAFSPPSWCKWIYFALVGAGQDGGTYFGGSGGGAREGWIQISEFEGNFGITYGVHQATGVFGGSGNTYFTAIPSIVGIGGGSGIAPTYLYSTTNYNAFVTQGRGFNGASGGAFNDGGGIAGGIGGDGSAGGAAGGSGAGGNGSGGSRYGSGSGGGGAGGSSNGGSGGYGSGGGCRGITGGVGGAGGNGFAVIWFFRGDEI
jgi:hypothetical protein